MMQYLEIKSDRVLLLIQMNFRILIKWNLQCFTEISFFSFYLVPNFGKTLCMALSQLTVTCSKSAIETLEKSVKYVQS